MLLCRPMAQRSTRNDVRYLDIVGFEEPSQLALVWRRDHATEQLTTLAKLLDEEFSRVDALPRP